MKKIICLVLALIAVCMPLVACGPGGDTNLHKVMEAMNNDEIICGYFEDADSYSYYSLPEVPCNNGWYNVNYDSIEAWSDNVYYRNHIMFKAELNEVRENRYQKEIRLTMIWRSAENELKVRIDKYDYNVWNNEARDPQYHGFYDDKGFEARSNTDLENYFIVFNMNDYYENGKFDLDDATYDISTINFSNRGNIVGCEDMVLEDMIDLLNNSLNGLNQVYGAKGYPIK